jgi:glycosyltransferase involved in cell wall biosynthesis
MRIAIVSDTFQPEINGVTTVLRRMVDGLSAMGHEVRVVAPQYPTDAAPEPGELRIPSVSFPPYPDVRFALPAIRRVSHFMRAFSPDVMHVATEGPLGWTGRHVAINQGIPLVTSYHTNFPIACRDYGVSWLEPVIWKWIEWFHRPAVLTQTPGEAARDMLHEHGLPQATVWGRGVDVSFFNPRRRSEMWRRTHRIPGSDVVVTHVGRLAREKNMPVLLEALNLLRDTALSSMTYVIAGGGPMRDEVVERSPFARHFGFLDREALADLYANSDLCVLPSQRETCGLVALEAMASGVPVIAADARGFRESIDHDVTGLLVPPDDARSLAAAIGRLAGSVGLRRSMAQRARRFAESRDADRENVSLVELYQIVVNGKGEAPCSVALS